MIIQPKVRGFICTTAHPEGCYSEVAKQIDYVKAQGKFEGPKRALIIGASTGYGLASRIVATFGANAKTVGVFYERAAEDKRTASAGWYNSAAFEQIAHKDNHYAKSINGDAFSDEIKRQTLDLIKRDLGTVDLVIYSLASPRRVDPVTGEAHSSVLKPIGESYTMKTVDPLRGEVKEITLSGASEQEIEDTVHVMGGHDWQLWIEALAKENLLAKNVITVAYSYIGPTLTHAIYKNGTIGRAKDHLHKTADKLSEKLAPLQGHAYVSVNKALVTQASAAIPVVPLYISLLYKQMKENGTHEGCIEQMARLFKDFLYSSTLNLDQQGLIRVDDWEMRPEIQQKIKELWPQVTTENLQELTDIEGYRDDFYRLFGFNQSQIDYNLDVEPNVAIESI
jgi:enoyl-[acyl-carrier protein] reductase/trans-2-enoyl-CoA reductase (NAD+)